MVSLRWRMVDMELSHGGVQVEYFGSGESAAECPGLKPKSIFVAAFAGLKTRPPTEVGGSHPGAKRAGGTPALRKCGGAGNELHSLERVARGLENTTLRATKHTERCRESAKH